MVDCGEMVDSAGGKLGKSPHLFLLPFDKPIPNTTDVPLLAPERSLVNLAKAEEKYTRIVIMSHGWQTSPSAAEKLYRLFFPLLHQTILANNSAENPLYIGVYWPSLAGGQTWNDYVDGKDVPTPTEKETLNALESELKAQYPSLGSEDIQGIVSDKKYGDIARIALSLADSDSDDPNSRPSTSDFLTRLARQFRDSTTRAFEAIKSKVSDTSELLQVQVMKNRAALVGSSAEMQKFLKQALETTLPVHLLGHSFGCRLMLEAVKVARARQPEMRLVTSLTLIQPAVSRWVFSKRKMGYLGRYNQKGLFAEVPAAVKNPIVVFYSDNDIELFRYYPLALGEEVEVKKEVREKVDMGESAGANYKHAALGAHGPDIAETDGGAVSFSVYGEKKEVAARVIGVKGTWSHNANEGDGWAKNPLPEIVRRQLVTGVIW